jgi:membrane protease YdiL (CAAX protease family)
MAEMRNVKQALEQDWKLAPGVLFSRPEPAVPFLAPAHLVFFGLYLPYVALRAARRNRRAPVPPRCQYFRSAILNLVTKGAISLSTALVVPLALFPAALPSLMHLLWGALACAGMIAVGLPHWRGSVARRERFAYFAMPQTREENGWWVVFSILAGVTEELTWRGVQVQLLTRLTGSLPLAATICCLTFGIGHIAQGWKWALATVGFAAVFQVLVVVTGSLYVAMAVHIVVDLVAGFYTARVARLQGYRLPDSMLSEATPATT